MGQACVNHECPQAKMRKIRGEVWAQDKAEDKNVGGARAVSVQTAAPLDRLSLSIARLGRDLGSHGNGKREKKMAGCQRSICDFVSCACSGMQPQPGARQLPLPA